MSGRIAFQGELGAYSHQACARRAPISPRFPARPFEDVVEMTRSGEVDLGMLAVENSTYGRVADVHSLLPKAGLHIVDEAFVRVHVNLLGVKGATVADVTEAHGHVVILPQCAGFLKRTRHPGRVSSDNARAAREVAEAGDQDPCGPGQRVGGRDLRP
jgi:prephenate dehydratase